MRKILTPFSMLTAGLLLGIISRLLDVYTQNLGNIFSQMAIWILLGTLISIYSETRKKAMINVFLFCTGMIFTYYVTAAITNGIYSKLFITGWTVFAFCSPLFAGFAWITKEKGIFPRIISIGIVGVSVLSSIILFDGFRIYDVLINGILIYFLFFAPKE
ncbi:MAG: DUF6518 family protein [Bacillota bacterium]|nr:DUF6518 family protein [Bacillota bacterium]